MSGRRESYNSRVASLADAIATRVATFKQPEEDFPKRIGRSTGVLYRFRVHTQKVHRGPVSHRTFEVVALDKADAWAIVCPVVLAMAQRVGIVAVRMLVDKVGKLLVPK